VRVVEADGVTDNGDNELAQKHAECTPDEERTTTELLNSPEGKGSRQDIDESEDEGDEESVGDRIGGLEEGGRIVEDKVNTGPLLHHLKGSSENGTTEIALRLPNATTEAVCPGGEICGTGGDLALVFGVDNDFSEFGFNIFRVTWLTTEYSQRVTGLFDLATLDEVTGRFRE